MSQRWLRAVCVAVGSLGVSSAAWAHHGDAGRYDEQVIVLTGTVVQMQMLNPHSMFVFEVAEPDGKKVKWQGELGRGLLLERDYGWTANTLKPGMMVTVTGRKVKSGAPYLNVTERANIVLTDSGKEIFRTRNYGEATPIYDQTKPLEDTGGFGRGRGRGRGAAPPAQAPPAQTPPAQ